MKTKRDRKTAILVGAVALTVVMVFSATFAWFTVNTSVKNRLATQDGLANIKIHEVFVEPGDWKPGQSITKEVSASNTGDAPALVRVSFDELLKVNRPAAGEQVAFSKALEDAGKRPLLVDSKMFAAADGWFEVTTTANTAQGGIKLAATYSAISVYARYNTTGSAGSYEFVIVSPIAAGNTYSGKFQDVTYDRAWDNGTKTLSLSSIKYMTYQGTITESVDWRVAKPAVTDIDTSRAEAVINARPEVAGKYPGNIKLNYANITRGGTPEAGKWYYNAADGYFYYVGLVEGGQVTPQMLKSLLLDNKADSQYYSNLVYELTVHLNAVQNTKDAVAAEWTTATGALKTAIDALCEY